MRIRGEPLKTTSSFPYLGVVQSDDASSMHAMQHRMGKASKAFRSMKSVWECPLNRRVKGRLYETTIRKIVLHGASTWTMRQADYRGIFIDLYIGFSIWFSIYSLSGIFVYGLKYLISFPIFVFVLFTRSLKSCTFN